MSMGAARKMADFEGVWQLRRQITHAGGAQAAFKGHANWVRNDKGLFYTETGQLRIAGQPSLEATQSYQWDTDLQVYFADGRFFHTVPAMGGAVDHWCVPDTYKGNYDFSGWPQWKVTWSVMGPAKNYASISAYEPDA